MSEFIYYIYYGPGFKRGKPDSLYRCSREEKSGIDTHLFDEGQLLDLENDHGEEEEYVEDMELKGTDVPTWEKKNGLWVVLQEYRLEELC